MAGAPPAAAGPEERSVRLCPRRSVLPVRLRARALHSEQLGSVSPLSDWLFVIHITQK